MHTHTSSEYPPSAPFSPAARHWKTALRFGPSALSALLLLAQARGVASTSQTLWLSAALCAALVPGYPRASTAVKAVEIAAASLLCALALVDTGS